MVAGRRRRWPTLAIGAVAASVLFAAWRDSAPLADSSGRLQIIPAFLSADEVRALRSLAAANHDLFATSEPLHYASVTLPSRWESGASWLTVAIEDRIANVSGIASNTQDSPLHLAVSRPYDGSLGHAFNMHHDTNKSPRRVATVIIYLSDEDEDGLLGGETVFPCLTFNRAANTASTPSDLCARLQDGFTRGHRFLRVATATSGSPAFDGEATAAASELCARGDSLAAREPSVRIIPRRGTALLFFSGSVHSFHRHMHADSWGDMWHGGCRVRQGEKWTLQLFKEMAIDDDGISRQADATAM